MSAFEKAILAKIFTKPSCFEKSLFLRKTCQSVVGFADQAREDFDGGFDHEKSAGFEAAR